MIEIGLSSACFYPKVLAEDSIKIMKKIGFDYGEIFLNTFSEYEEDFILKIKDQCEKNEFNINSVHIYSSMFEPFLFDAYKRRREDMMGIFKKVCKAIDILGGGKIYTFHGMRKIDSLNMDYELVVDMYNRLTYYAGENNVKLAQENVSWCMSSDLEYLSLLKEKVKYPLYYTLDLKQCYKSNIEPQEYINVMGKEICNFHINDKNENESCMLPGRGNISYSKIFKSLDDINYKGRAIIEVYGDNYKSYDEILESKVYLDKLIKTIQ